MRTQASQSVGTSWRDDRRIADRPVAGSSFFSTVLLAETITRVLPRQATVVVDVGGGEAPYRRKIDASVHLSVDRRSPPQTLATHQVVADACRLPVPDATADLVLCTEVVEHVADDRALYRELRRITADHGALVLSAPFVHPLHESPHDYRRPTSAGLAHGLRSAGFEIESIDAVAGTGALLVDVAVRSIGPKVSALDRRAPDRLGRALRETFGHTQVALADQILRRSGRRHAAIDPLIPAPRLTLGYVVKARPLLGQPDEGPAQ